MKSLLIHQMSDEIKEFVKLNETLIYQYNQTMFYLVLHKLAHDFDLNFDFLHKKLCDAGLVDTFLKAVSWQSTSNIFQVANDGNLLNFNMGRISSIETFLKILVSAEFGLNNNYPTP